MKKIISLVLLLFAFFFLLSTNSAFAATNKITLYYGRECPHCQEEEEFLDQLQKENPDLTIERIEVWHNQENQKKFQEVSRNFNNPNFSVPLTIIGNEAILGFNKAETTGQKIRQLVGLEDTVDKEVKADKDSQLTKIPLIGSINLSKLSLPALTVILGLIDGFNPCAMWALIALLAFLIGLNSRTKVITIGGLFILTSYLASFLYMSAWLNVFTFLQYVGLIKYLVAFASLVIGMVYLRDFIKNKQDCEVIDPKQRKKIFQRMKEVGSAEFWLTAVIGTIILALTVNVIEFVCSVGLPVIFTQVLAQQNITGFQKYLYILVYNLFYMLDDFIVFFLAIFSARVVSLSGVYSRWSRLIGAIILFILAIWMIFFSSGS